MADNEINIAALFEEVDVEVDAPLRCHHLDNEDAIEKLKAFLISKLPDCYASAQHLQRRSSKVGCSVEKVLCNRLPGQGKIMAGDFGEILTLFFLSSECDEDDLHHVLKWRYKQDRHAAAPHSDTLVIRQSDDSPEDDFIIVAEAKMKATRSKTWDPINSALEGMEKDYTGRLARTLTWLEEKYLDEESIEDIELIGRFTDASNPPYEKEHKAVAIIDLNFLDAELRRELKLPEKIDSYEIITLGLSDLKEVYEAVYQHFYDEQ